MFDLIHIGTFQGITREWLYWYDEQGNRYLTSEEARQEAEFELQQERQGRLEAEVQRQQAEQRVEKLAARLRELGIDPDQLN